jgi:thymidylate synthase (FAD)
MTACKYAEHLYFSLIDDGCTPQEARSVLPNSLKTELVMTTNMREWIHFFKMRVPSAAHPQMREVSIPLFKDVLNIYPRIFRDYEYFINEHEVTK